MADSFPPPPPARPPYSKFTRSLDSALTLKAGKIEIIENNSEVGESGSQIYVLIYSLIVVAAVMYLFYCVRDKSLCCFKSRRKSQLSTTSPTKSTKPSKPTKSKEQRPAANRRGSIMNQDDLEAARIEAARYDTSKDEIQRYEPEPRTSARTSVDNRAAPKQHALANNPQLSAPARTIHCNTSRDSNNEFNPLNSFNIQQIPDFHISPSSPENLNSTAPGGRLSNSVKGTSDSPNNKPKFDYAKTVKEKRELRRYASGIVPSTYEERAARFQAQHNTKRNNSITK